MVEVKIGDKIYLSRYGSLYSIEEVTKITATMIKTKNHNYKLSGNYLRVLGQGKWATTSAALETPELKQQWHEKQLRYWMEKHYTTIPVEYIEEIKDKMESK